MKKPPTLIFSALLAIQLFTASSAVAEGLFVSDSKHYGESKMDIVVRETERRSRSSLVEVTINKVGSSVGSSFFLLCSLRNLGRERGFPRYIAKAENFPAHRTWLVAFLNGPDDDPKQADPQLAEFPKPVPVIDLQQFAPICDRMGTEK